MKNSIDRLNAIERRFLRRLAEGHTAKSIAAAEGCSLSAVNERLREARRKTGVGSSRELARLLAAQENRDDQIGLARIPTSRPAPGRQAWSPAQAIGWTSMLILTGTAAIALAGLFLSSAAPHSYTAQAPSLRDATEPAYLRLTRTLEAERRDAKWADAIEPALKHRIGEIEQLTERTVRCGAVLCEVSGRLTATAGGSIDSAMQILQGPALDTEMRALGLQHVLSHFGPAPGAARQARYVSFWKRMPGR